MYANSYRKSALRQGRQPILRLYTHYGVYNQSGAGVFANLWSWTVRDLCSVSVLRSRNSDVGPEPVQTIQVYGQISAAPFRTEFFNAFNHPNFANPSANIGRRVRLERFNNTLW